MCAAPSSFGRRRLLVVVALFLAVALSGCGLFFGGGDSGTTLPPGEQAAETYLSLDGYEATVHYEYSNRTDRRAHIEVDVDGGRSRLEWLAPDRLDDNLVIYNGSSVVRYNATTNEFVRISTSDIDYFEDGAERIESVIDAARKEGEMTVEKPPAGGAPLPVVPKGESADTDTDRKFEVSYEGTETVAGREAHVIRYAAAENGTNGILEQKIWVDTEYFFTLKSKQVSRFEGNRSTFTFRLSNVSVSPGLTAQDFRFDPPQNATLNQSGSYDVTGYDTRSELASVADITVPDPSVPTRFSLSRTIHVVGENFTAVQLQYQTGGSRLFVTKTAEQDYTNLTEGERVSIGGHTGRYRASGTSAIVVWQCDGFVYTVNGAVQKSTLLDVARSVECE